MSRTAGVMLAAALGAAFGAQAQWSKVRDPALPRAADGSPDLTAPAPRAPDGKPDLSGVWNADVDPTVPIVTVEHRPFARYFINIAADIKPEDDPLQPWAREIFMQRLQEGGTTAPGAHCAPMGFPLLHAAPLPQKIVQTPSSIIVLYEENTIFREIHLDDREPIEDAEPRWMGYSTGRWEGDALVVRSRGFQDRHWLDAMGHPNTDQLRLTERYRRRDAGHLDVEITIDDPGAYTRPITFTSRFTLMPDDELLEYFCTENERSSEHYQAP